MTKKPEKKAPAGAYRAVRDPERTRALILAAAAGEFAEKGIGGARVDAIADRAGTNKRMLYHYFGDKEGLYVAVLENAYAAIRSAEHALDLAHRPPAEGLRELALFTWRYFLKNPEFLSLLNTENLHGARYLKRSARVLDMHSNLQAELAEVLRRGEADGSFRAGNDPVEVYVTIAALCFFYLSNRHTLSVIFDRDLTDPAHIASWEERVVATTLASVRA
jgi:TetR/AcrR family transcriptional regulator